MKILYITSVPLEYSSSANLRNIALIRGLIQNGHEVSTLSTESQKSSACYDKSLMQLEVKNRYFIELGQLHAKLNSAQKGSLKLKIKGKLYKLYTAFNLYDSRKNEVSGIDKIDFSSQKFDVIISSSDPKSSHLFAERLLKLHPDIANKWIQYWGDPFTGDINRWSLVPNFAVLKEEKRLLSLCDKAVYVSPMTAGYIKKKHKEFADKIQFVPVGYSEEKLYPKHESSTLDLCYCGDYYSKDRNVQPLFDAVKQMREQCCLTVAGNSDIALNSDENITVYPRVEKKKVDEIEQNSDVIVCVCNRKGTQIPGKIYHASATNRAILILLDGDCKNEIKSYFSEYDRFVFCENKKDDIVKTLKAMCGHKMDSKPCKKLNGVYVAQAIVEDGESE